MTIIIDAKTSECRCGSWLKVGSDPICIQMTRSWLFLMRSNPIVLIRLTVLAFAFQLPGAILFAQEKAIADQGSDFLSSHCADCHSNGNAEAGFDIGHLDRVDKDQESFRRWSMVYRRVLNHEMPPVDYDVPDENERSVFLESLKSSLTNADRQRIATEGRAAVRRLNRTEFHNTLRDVLEMPNLDVIDMLPPDGSFAGFNKSTESLDFSHVHVSKWIDAVDEALRQAVAPTLKKPEARKIRATINGVDSARDICQGFYSMLKQGRAIPLVGNEPDQTIQIKSGVFANRDPGFIKDPDPKIDGLAFFVNGTSNLGMAIKPFRVELPGYYVLRVHGWGMLNQRGKLVDSARTETLGFYTDDRLLGYCDLPSYEPTTAEVKVWLRPGDRIFPLVSSSTYPVIRVGKLGKNSWQKQTGNGVAIQWLEMEGPIVESWPPRSHHALFGATKRLAEKGNSESRRSSRREVDSQIQPFKLKPDDPIADGRRLIRKFLVRSLRRPVTNEDMTLPVQVFRNKLDKGVEFKEALLAAYRAILCSPEVVLISTASGQLTSHQLVERLAYFLWSSPPDRELRKLAEAGELTDGQLEDQVVRMLKHEKAQRFRVHFLNHWLNLKDIELTEPDVNLYPEYNPMALDSMLKESHQYFKALVDEDLGVTHFVSSDFTFANQRLAELYGFLESLDDESDFVSQVPERRTTKIAGSELQRFPLGPNSLRGGFLTQAAVLKTTANGTTTSPVVRGEYVMRRLLGQPPPPPPPTVPAVEPDISGEMTIREQLALHREDPSCNACHAKIDPPGFALESFDVMGGFRKKYRSVGEGELIPKLLKDGGKASGVRVALDVDASGELQDGTKFNGISEFKVLLTRQKDQLADNFLRNLILYATGAEVGFADEAELERIKGESVKSGYGIRSMIVEVVKSDLFKSK